MRRRTLLRVLAAAAAWVRVPPYAAAQTPTLSAADQSRLRALAEVILPGELGIPGRAAVVDQFVNWIRNYRPDVEMDHGYGFPRLRKTPASPALKYPAQLAALESAARAKGGALESLPVEVRHAIVEQALNALKIDRLPARPTGEHVVTDLMGFYFHGSAANDLACRAAIGRDDCRGLPGSDERPERTGSR
jgi:hypothetical protein